MTDSCFDYMQTPIGRLCIVDTDSAVSAIHFEAELFVPEFPQRETLTINSTKKQLAEYFSGQRRVFDLPLTLSGTVFRMTVWGALLAIPYGETRSYGQIASAVGKSGSGRAVGGAVHNNPIGIVIPCHRVIGSDGSMTGFGGGLDVKQYLLKLEGIAGLPA